jgi:hypothetical protein
MQTSTLRPGLLVSLKTTIAGNVQYQTKMLEEHHFTAEGAQKARWETERLVVDPVEHDAAKLARSSARNKIASICATSAFGLLCPESRESELEAAVAEARSIADGFNATAKWTRIGVYVMTGRIATDDAEAVRAINSEVSALLERMETGVKNLDAEAIRKAANAARSLGAMLSSAAVERVSIAIEAARGAARQIAKAGEQAAGAVDLAAIRKISEQRMAFLDFDDAADVGSPIAEGRAVEFEPSNEDCAIVTRRLSAALEL